MSVNIEAEILIRRPKSEVAAYAMDSDNDPHWISGIIGSKGVVGLPMEKGVLVGREAKFMGRSVECTNEILECVADESLTIRSEAGPFLMMVRYEFQEAKGGTLTRINVSGDVKGFFKLATPVLSRMVQRRLSQDLMDLKHLLEDGPESPY